MTRKLIAIAAATCLLAPTAALAGTATYTTKGGPAKTVGTAEYQGSYQEGTSVVTFSDGSTSKESWTCIGTSQPPNGKIFDFHFACDATGDAGSYSMIFGCNNGEAEGAQGCVGGLNGKTGKYEGKNGATTWAGVNGNGMGTMQWND
ncbi:MAG: hypothetical protein EP350_01385 [Alphaproteobacteria bacterium]|nr:MAG: hypothetical protein EP350_01385 [Alphaproteobacteria bacterium]